MSKIMNSSLEDTTNQPCRIVSSLKGILNTMNGTLDEIKAKQKHERKILHEKFEKGWEENTKLLEMFVRNDQSRILREKGSDTVNHTLS